MSRPLIRRLRLILVCLLVAVCGQLLFSFLVRTIDEAHYARQRLEVINRLGELRLKLEQRLNTAFYVSRGLEMLITGLTADGSQLGDHWGEIRQWSRQAAVDLPYVSSIGLSDGYVIRFAYPREANKAVLGVDYRELDEQWPAIRRAVQTREPVVAGPLELIQGGTGIICRIPLFTDRLQQEGGRFVGIVSMVLDYDQLMKLTGLTALRDELAIAIRGLDGRGVDGEVFLGNTALFEGDSVRQRVEFLGGNWVIVAKPPSGWSYESPYSRGLNALGLLVSLRWWVAHCCIWRFPVCNSGPGRPGILPANWNPACASAPGS